MRNILGYEPTCLTYNPPPKKKKKIEGGLIVFEWVSSVTKNCSQKSDFVGDIKS